MEKFRLILKWNSDYSPAGYRTDGQLQEKVARTGIESEEEAKRLLKNYETFFPNGNWLADRYEIDDDKYMQYELILPKSANYKTKPEEAQNLSLFIPKKERKVSVRKSKSDKEVSELIAEVLDVKTTEFIETKVSPTKTIYVAKYIATQRALGEQVAHISGRLSSAERMQIYDDFNSNKLSEISVTEAVIRMGGIKYEKNGKEIDIKFLDDIDHHTKSYVLSRVNTK